MLKSFMIVKFLILALLLQLIESFAKRILFQLKLEDTFTHLISDNEILPHDTTLDDVILFLKINEENIFKFTFADLFGQGAFLSSFS